MTGSVLTERAECSHFVLMESSHQKRRFPSPWHVQEVSEDCFHVFDANALEDSYLRAHWHEIDALCKFNSIPFNATGEKIRDGGLCMTTN
jgi:hypothetical protein